MDGVIKRVKFKLAKDFPFYIEREVITILPIGTEFVMDMPAEVMQKMAGLGYIQARLKAEGRWPTQ